ncbi:MAG TPA: cyclic nucleotide-binding domain-containing protein [Mucilaginibacter sp.]
MSTKLITFLRSFRNIPDADAALIIAAAQERVYKEGDYLFKAENICREIFFICKGVLRIMVTNKSGNEVTHFFLKKNQFCTILNSFDNHVIAHESICAACDTEVLAFNRANLDKLYAQLPYLKGLIDGITHQALLDKIALRNRYLGHNSTTQYKMFMELQPEVALQVQLSDVASYLGITPQSLSRIRKNIR